MRGRLPAHETPRRILNRATVITAHAKMPIKIEANTKMLTLSWGVWARNVFAAVRVPACLTAWLAEKRGIHCGRNTSNDQRRLGICGGGWGFNSGCGDKLTLVLTAAVGRCNVSCAGVSCCAAAHALACARPMAIISSTFSSGAGHIIQCLHLEMSTSSGKSMPNCPG